MGDFNIDLLDIKNNNTEKYVETMFNYYYYSLINKPTRIQKINALLSTIFKQMLSEPK